jgi:hypothetical protein
MNYLRGSGAAARKKALLDAEEVATGGYTIRNVGPDLQWAKKINPAYKKQPAPRFTHDRFFTNSKVDKKFGKI